MHRIDSATAEADTFGAGKDGFTAGDPGTFVPPTDLTADFFNALQEEIASIVESYGNTALSKPSNGQVLIALRSPVGLAAATGGDCIAATGGTGSGGTGGAGLKGTGGGTNGYGVYGVGAGNRPGVYGVGSGTPVSATPTTGSGVVGLGGQTNGYGGEFFSKGSGAGVIGTGGTTGRGLHGIGGSAGGEGVYGIGTVAGSTGVYGQGQATGGVGVIGNGGATNGPGVFGTGGGTGEGVKGTGGATGTGVYGVGGATSGFGVRAEADTTNPQSEALYIVPQDLKALAPTKGGVQVLSGGKLGVYNGSTYDRYVAQSAIITSNVVSAASTGDQTLSTYTIPANVLTTGSTIRVRMAGLVTAAGGGAAVVPVIYVNGTAVCSILKNALANDAFYLEVIITIIGVGSTSARSGGFAFMGANGATTGVTSQYSSAPTIDNTATCAVAAHVDLTNSGDQVTLREFVVEVL